MLLAGPQIKSESNIQSFALTAPDLVLAIPLMDADQVRGVLYLESEIPSGSLLERLRLDESAPSLRAGGEPLEPEARIRGLNQTKW